MADNTNADQNDQQDDKAKDKDGESTEGLKSALQAERDARKQLDRDLKAVRSELTTMKNAGKSETDRLAALEKERDDLQKAVRDRDAKDATRDAAKRAGAPDPDLIFRVIKTDLEYDSDGKPTNLSELVSDLKTTTPHLFKTTPARVDGGAGAGGRTNATDMNARIRQAAGVAE